MPTLKLFSEEQFLLRIPMLTVILALAVTRVRVYEPVLFRLFLLRRLKEAGLVPVVLAFRLAAVVRRPA